MGSSTDPENFRKMIMRHPRMYDRVRSMILEDDLEGVVRVADDLGVPVTIEDARSWLVPGSKLYEELTARRSYGSSNMWFIGDLKKGI